MRGDFLFASPPSFPSSRLLGARGEGRKATAFGSTCLEGWKMKEERVKKKSMKSRLCPSKVWKIAKEPGKGLAQQRNNHAFKSE